jgi:CRP-like cAMP-binding protein
MIQPPEDDIRQFIRRFANPPADQVNDFIAKSRRAVLPKGKALVGIGDTTHPLYFVHSGIIRYMLIIPGTGEDVTKDFSFAPTFAASFGSSILAQPSRIGIVALTDCATSLWPLGALTSLFDRHIEWQKLGRKLAEWLYVRKEDREISFITQTTEDRYAALADAFPDRISLVPQHHIASYLGITPESLSRLRARVAAKAKKSNCA